MQKFVDRINSYIITRPRKALAFTALFWVLLFTILVIFAHRIPGTDDFVFPEQIKPFPTLWAWLEYRYNTWSGRFFSEAFMYIFSPLPLIFWKVISVALYGVFMYYAYVTYLLFAKHPTPRQKVICFSLICAIPYLMDVYTYHDATFWVTGGMAYFWVTTLGLCALYPILYSVVNNKQPRWHHTLPGVLTVIIAMSSQEQLGAFLVTAMSLMLCVMLYLYAHKSITFPLLTGLATYVAIGYVSFLLSITAPGNDARISAEIIRWIPDFTSAPIDLRVNYSVRWFLEAIINHTGYLLPLSWLGLAALYWKFKTKLILHRLIAFALLLLALVTLLKGYQPFASLFIFHAQWGVAHFSTLSNLLLLFWLGAIALTTVAALILTRKQIGWYLSALFSAAFATTAIVTLSPTMYASGWRTLYIPSLLIAAAATTIYCFLINNSSNRKLHASILISVLFLTMCQFAHILTIILK